FGNPGRCAAPDDFALDSADLVGVEASAGGKWRTGRRLVGFRGRLLDAPRGEQSQDGEQGKGKASVHEEPIPGEKAVRMRSRRGTLREADGRFPRGPDHADDDQPRLPRPPNEGRADGAVPVRPEHTPPDCGRYSRLQPPRDL